MEEMLGGVRITYLGHATFRFVTPGDEQIIIDPFLTENPQTPDDLKRVGELDTILVTHGHFDHLGDAAVLARDRGAALRADLDRLVTQALIPERAARLQLRDPKGAAAGMLAEWEAFKASWSR